MDVERGRRLTRWAMAAFGLVLLAFVGYDFLASSWGYRATVTAIVVDATTSSPVLIFLVGMVIGGLAVHFWWRPETEPGYKFRYDQGRKALERLVAARGLLRTGGTAKTSEALASQEPLPTPDQRAREIEGDRAAIAAYVSRRLPEVRQRYAILARGVVPSMECNGDYAETGKRVHGDRLDSCIKNLRQKKNEEE